MIGILTRSLGEGTGGAAIGPDDVLGDILRRLGLHYRVIRLCTSDLSFAARPGAFAV